MRAQLRNDDSASQYAVGCARLVLARKWAYLISTTAYVPMARAELEQNLLILVNRLFTVAHSEPVDTEPAVEVGGRLVEMQCVGPDSIRRTVEVLGRALMSQSVRSDRVVRILGAMASGYSEELRRVTRRRQEDLHQSLIRMAQEARRNQVDSEAQFDELLANSMHGIALTALDGHVVRANASLAATLERSVTEIAEHTLFDVVHPSDVAAFRAAYEDLLSGTVVRLQHSCRLVRKDGGMVWVSFAGSMVHDLGGSAKRVVMIVTDQTEVSLLRNQLSHQSLHDSLTGLPNRQFLTTRMEDALRRARLATGITLYHLNLDGFSLVANGFGPETGDLLLRRVADRLRAAVAEENAIVARLGGDEFAILVENTSTTPDVVSMVEFLNQELSEPIYIDGQHGLAASASIGVVHRPRRDAQPAELLRAADIAVRRAKSYGRRQWYLYDSDRDARDRERFRLAASMPGAWEIGEIGVVYRPSVRLADGEVVGVEAVLRWDHPELGSVPHNECVELAEKTGLILPMGRWMLRSACEQVLHGGGDLMLGVRLTRSESADPDLVSGIRRALEDAGLSARRLLVGLPAQTLLATGSAEAADNRRVLADIGVGTVIHDFGAAGELACLEDPAPRAVRLASRLVERQAVAGEDPVVARAITNLIDLAHVAGAKVIVDGIATEEQVDWWRQAGADIGLGAAFPSAVHDLPGPAL